MRVLLTIQYLGTRYAGWQRQANALAVQQVMEGALEKMCGQSLHIEGASRTDAGVHAVAQRAHADIPIDIDARGIVLGLNDLLPHDIRITVAQQVADGFHCRFEALEKTYEYRIWNAPVADVFHFETYAHLVAQLDAEAMREAAAALVGQHDFRAFTVPQPGVSSMVRTVLAADVVRERAAVRFTITADGFLRFMVRRIAGSLIEIGRGRMGREGIATALEPHFGIARWTAPAKGLVLQSIRYSEPL